jgi:hypothetical protein
MERIDMHHRQTPGFALARFGAAGHLTSAVALALALSVQTPGAAQQQPASATPAQPAGRGGPPGVSNAPGGFPRVPTLPFPDAAREVETVGVKLRAVPVA